MRLHGSIFQSWVYWEQIKERIRFRNIYLRERWTNFFIHLNQKMTTAKLSFEFWDLKAAMSLSLICALTKPFLLTDEATVLSSFSYIIFMLIQHQFFNKFLAGVSSGSFNRIFSLERRHYLAMYEFVFRH